MAEVVSSRESALFAECASKASQGVGLDQIARIQSAHPLLTWSGFWSPFNLPPGTLSDEARGAPATRPWPRYQQEFQVQREKMLTAYALEEFHLASAFLASCPRQKTMNRRIGTGTLKHVAEAWWREKHGQGVYIPRGMFIAAAIAGGFTVQRMYDRWDAHLNVSRFCRDLPSLLRHQERAAAVGGA